ncbi:MAG: acetoacetate decarboxylase family protein [Deltaproteobacteria bacterium]|nr:acetoacetate decarboxylase family protein [Deltaproteobacteria bacterium]
MTDDLFAGIVQWEMDWQGRKAKLPVFYYDNTAFTAIFAARVGRLRRLLPHPDLRPIELYPGTGLLAFTCFEYRRTDIDPYNELSIAVLATLRSRTLPGLSLLAQVARRCFHAYVWQLPVTTEIARVGGVDLYGYPKFIAGIDFERPAGGIACHLSLEGKPILSLRGPALPTGRGKLTRYVTYSIKDGIPLVANVVTDPLEYAESFTGAGATLELHGDHPIAAQLREVGLGTKPVLYQYAPRTQAILFSPRNLIDC